MSIDGCEADSDGSFVCFSIDPVLTLDEQVFKFEVLLVFLEETPRIFKRYVILDLCLKVSGELLKEESF